MSKIPDLSQFRNKPAAAVIELKQLDPNKMYYTEEMLSRDGSEFILTLLLSAGVVTEEDVRKAKAEFMADQNALLIKTAETNPQVRAILIELDNAKLDPSKN